MIWVAWRQQRLQVLLTVGLVLAVAVVLAVFRDIVLSVPREQVSTAESNDRQDYVDIIKNVLFCLPVLAGMFVGGPLFAREIEHRTHLFGLTQSVGRVRWWATKAAVAGLPVVVAVLALGLVSTWVLPVIDSGFGRMHPQGFEVQGPALPVYTVFAFAVGATAGLVLRNTVKAMAITFGVYVAVRIAVTNFVRPGYLEPLYVTAPFPVRNSGIFTERSTYLNGGMRLDSDDLLLEHGFFGQQGQPLHFSLRSCSGSTELCMQNKGIASQYVKIQPAERFWAFQLIKTGLFLALAAALLGLGVWWLRKRSR